MTRMPFGGAATTAMMAPSSFSEIRFGMKGIICHKSPYATQ